MRSRARSRDTFMAYYHGQSCVLQKRKCLVAREGGTLDQSSVKVRPRGGQQRKGRSHQLWRWEPLVKVSCAVYVIPAEFLRMTHNLSQLTRLLQCLSIQFRLESISQWVLETSLCCDSEYMNSNLTAVMSNLEAMLDFANLRRLSLCSCVHSYLSGSDPRDHDYAQYPSILSRLYCTVTDFSMRRSYQAFL